MALQQGLRWNYHGSHATASDNEPQTRQDAYALLDYRLELSPSDDWSVALLARNLTDERYLAGADGGSAFLGAPRTVTASLTLDF